MKQSDGQSHSTPRRLDAASPVPTERFVVVTGIDGAGKTTLIAELVKRRPQWVAGSIDPKQWLRDVQLPPLQWALTTHPKDLLPDLAPCTRATMLMSVLFSHFEYWLAPRLCSGNVVVLDSYYYRFFAKERVRGQAPQFFYEALETLPSPAMVVRLDIPPARALERKASLDSHDVGGEATPEGFVRFQSDVAKQLDSVIRRSGTQVVTVDATRSPADVLEQVVALIDEAQAGGRSMPSGS